MLKLTVVFTYFVIKVGGLIGYASASMMVTGGDAMAVVNEGVRGFAAGTIILTFIAAVIGAPYMAYLLVFGDKNSLSSIGFNKFGGRQLAQAALSVIGSVSAAGIAGRAVSGGVRGVNKIKKAGTDKPKPPSSPVNPP